MNTDVKISSGGYQLSLRDPFYIIPDEFWSELRAQKCTVKALKKYLSELQPYKPLYLVACGYGSTPNIDKSSGKLFAISDGKLFVHSGLNRHYAIWFHGVDITLLERSASASSNGSVVGDEVSDGDRRSDFLINLLQYIEISGKQIILIETIERLIRSVCHQAPPAVVNKLYKVWVIDEMLLLLAPKSETGAKAVKIDTNRLRTLVDEVQMAHDIADAEDAEEKPLTQLTVQTTISNQEEVFLEEQHNMNAQSSPIINNELTALMADLFAKHMQTGPNLQKLQAERDTQETERLRVRAKIAEEQRQEVQLEKDVKTLQAEVDRCQPILDAARQDFVEAVKSEAEASATSLLDFQQNQDLVFAASEATARRMDAMSQVKTHQTHLSTAQSQLQESHSSYEIVKKSRMELDAQHEEIYQQIQQLDRQIEQMKGKTRATVSRKQNPEMVASLELLRELANSVTIVD